MFQRPTSPSFAAFNQPSETELRDLVWAAELALRRKRVELWRGLGASEPGLDARTGLAQLPPRTRHLLRGRPQRPPSIDLNRREPTPGEHQICSR